MKLFVPFMLLGVLATTPNEARGSGHSTSDPDFQFIHQVYAYTAYAAAHLDATKSHEYDTADYTIVSGGHVFTLAQSQEADAARFQAYAAERAKITVTYKITELSRKGPNIEAVVRTSVHGETPDGQVVVDQRTVRHDTWIPTADGWACKRSAVTMVR